VKYSATERTVLARRLLPEASRRTAQFMNDTAVTGPDGVRPLYMAEEALSEGK
jgi:hypothetical protein